MPQNFSRTMETLIREHRHRLEHPDTVPPPREWPVDHVAAAAPDMLAALRAVVAAKPPLPVDVTLAVLAAIRKAEGR